MTKKDLVKKIFAPKIWKNFKKAYGCKSHNSPHTNAQKLLIDGIINDIYEDFGKKLTVKELESLI